MCTHSDGCIPSCHCKNVSTRYNTGTNALHFRLDIIYDIVSSNWIQIIRSIFLALNGGRIIKQDWCIAALQLVQSFNFLLQEHGKETFWGNWIGIPGRSNHGSGDELEMLPFYAHEIQQSWPLSGWYWGLLDRCYRRMRKIAELHMAYLRK